ncbi:MAG: hypothetical protein JXJ22_14395 [Bacteroidales bacterium]|nr:hypothetical protein [Bacteroidales bacterium]
MEEGEDRNLIDDGKYSFSIINYFNRKGISWTAWEFDPDWVPQLIKNWEYDPTSQGIIFRDVMLGKFKYEE